MHALKTLFKIIKPSTSLELLEGHIGQIINLLFSASDQPALKLLAQVMIMTIFQNNKICAKYLSFHRKSYRFYLTTLRHQFYKIN